MGAIGQRSSFIAGATQRHRCTIADGTTAKAIDHISRSRSELPTSNYWGVLTSRCAKNLDKGRRAKNKVLDTNLLKAKERQWQGEAHHRSQAIKCLPSSPQTQGRNLATCASGDKRSKAQVGSHIGPQVLLPPPAVAPQHQEMDEIQSLCSGISSGGHALRVGLGPLVGQQIQQAHQDMDESSTNCWWIDDVLILGESATQVEHRAIAVVNMLTSMGIQVNQAKSMQHAAQQFPYVGHHFNLEANVVEPLPHKQTISHNLCKHQLKGWTFQPKNFAALA